MSKAPVQMNPPFCPVCHRVMVWMRETRSRAKGAIVVAKAHWACVVVHEEEEENARRRSAGRSLRGVVDELKPSRF